ncbi:MAG: hypothetical protein EZS28_030541 [Streblomastix strix]|uniref:HTH CENPB-type domain-containing protein n=1 Tax=Streblomastix strix TaxID=222440 RepID=A0A5J4UUB5_9EUKA|nr:MAG: hypothetical protein EZS28_030541 [Streblomastix strix]
MTDNASKLASLNVTNKILKIVNTDEFRKRCNINGLVAYELMYNMHFTADQVKASGVAGSNGVKKARHWIIHHRYPGRPGPDTILYLEEEEELNEKIHREIFERTQPTLNEAFKLMEENGRLEKVKQHLRKSWVNKYIRRQKQFHVCKGHVLDEKRFLATTFLNILPFFNWLLQIFKNGKYSEFNIWSFDETNVQLFFTNSTLMVTDSKQRYQFRCGSSPRPNYTLSLCVSAAG